MADNSAIPDECSMKQMGKDQASKVFAQFGQDCEPQIEKMLSFVVGGTSGTDAMQRTLQDISN